MIPADYLLITEIGTSKQYQIPLSQIRRTQVTIGRAGSGINGSDHVKIADGLDFVSRWQCTIFSQPRDDDPDLTDYYVRDGREQDGQWLESTQGVWVGDHRVRGPIQLRPSMGRIFLFPKLPDSTYHCILEWPAEEDPGRPREAPTTQEFENALRDKRVFQAEARHLSEQLRTLAENMAGMQASFNGERQIFDDKLNQQSTLLMTMSRSLEQEKAVNEQQERSRIALQKQARRQRIATGALGLIVLVVAVIALNMDQEMVRNLLEWSLIIVGGLGAFFGVAKDA